MRLRDMLDIVHRNEGMLALNPEPWKSGSMRIQTPHVTRQSLRELATITPFSEVATELAKSAFLGPNHHDALIVHPTDHAEFNQFQERLSALRNCVNLLGRALEQALPDENPNALAIELPNDGDIKQVIARLNVIKGLLLDVGGTEPVSVEVQGFDSGSLVIEIVGHL